MKKSFLICINECEWVAEIFMELVKNKRNEKESKTNVVNFMDSYIVKVQLNFGAEGLQPTNAGLKLSKKFYYKNWAPSGPKC